MTSVSAFKYIPGSTIISTFWWVAQTAPCSTECSCLSSTWTFLFIWQSYGNGTWGKMIHYTFTSGPPFETKSGKHSLPPVYWPDADSTRFKDVLAMRELLLTWVPQIFYWVQPTFCLCHHLLGFINKPLRFWSFSVIVDSIILTKILPILCS